jgi:signal peptidase II
MCTEARAETVNPVARNRYLLFLLVAAGGAAADLLTKGLVFAWLGPPNSPDGRYWLVPRVFAFTTWFNEGALFGMGQGFNFLFAGLSVVAAVAILYWLFVLKAAHDGRLNLAMALVMAGILGNLYDRLGLHGLTTPDGTRVFAVRDFLDFALINWPIFNLADSFLVFGAALLFLLSFQTHSAHAEAKGVESPSC